jgi:hypothetical protein
MACGKDLLWGMSMRGPSYRASSLQCIELVLFLNQLGVFGASSEKIGTFGSRTTGFGYTSIIEDTNLWDMWEYWTKKFQAEYRDYADMMMSQPASSGGTEGTGE